MWRRDSLIWAGGILIGFFVAIASLVLAQPTGTNTPAVVGVITVNTPTTVAALPSCTAALQGARAVVTNQATATAYLGAVTNAGSTIQSVLCNGTSWVQD